MQLAEDLPPSPLKYEACSTLQLLQATPDHDYPSSWLGYAMTHKQVVFTHKRAAIYYWGDMGVQGFLKL